MGGDTAVRLSLTPEFETVPDTGSDAEFALDILATLQAHDPEEAQAERAERAPIRLSAVVDKSGSMSGSKMSLVQETLRFVAAQLTDKDSMGIVQYDTEVSVLAPMTTGDEAGKKELTRRVNSLRVGSCTNLSGGLLQGIKQIQGGGSVRARSGSLLERASAMFSSSKTETETTQSSDDGAVNAVLLMTDGLANRGIRGTSGIVQAMEKQLRQQGVPRPTVFTFGFGTDHDEGMLSAIAEAGRGVYYFIESASKIPDAFADCLGGLVSVVARGLKLTVRSGDGGQVKLMTSPMTTYPFEVEDDGSLCVRIEDLYGEESRDVLFGVQVRRAGERGAVQLLEATLEYTDAQTTETVTVAATCSAERVDGETRGEVKPNTDVEMQRSRYQAAMAIKDAAELATNGMFDEAKGKLGMMKNNLEANGLMGMQMAQELCEDMDELEAEMEDETSYQVKGSKVASGLAQEWCNQRSAGTSKARFATKAKKSMVSKYYS